MEKELEINKGDKFYPGHYMWTYCRFLGKFTDSQGNNYDLGIYFYPNSSTLPPSEATVYGNEDHEYYSGSLTRTHVLAMVKDYPNHVITERYLEGYNRAVKANLIKDELIIIEQEEPDKNDNLDGYGEHVNYPD